MRVGLALVALVLNAVAIVSILGQRTVASRKVGWIVAVVLLPFIGSIGWLYAQRTGRHGQQRPSE